MKYVILLSVTIVALYYLMFFWLFSHPYRLDNAPVLNDRLGTILYHSEPHEKNTTAHMYCYYPKSSAHLKEGELLIQKATSMNDCSNWFGMLVRFESSEASEAYFYTSLPLD